MRAFRCRIYLTQSFIRRLFRRGAESGYAPGLSGLLRKAWSHRTLIAMPVSPLIRFGTSTWTYEGWQRPVYKRQYAKSKFAQECLGEYCQYQYHNDPLFRTVGNDATF